MLKRIELHNHSLESDGRMSVSELVSWLVSNRITAFSLTDHNTVSGLPVLKKLQEENPVFEYLNGYELTSWYGHILCQNVSGYIPGTTATGKTETFCSTGYMRREDWQGSPTRSAFPIRSPTGFALNF